MSHIRQLWRLPDPRRKGARLLMLACVGNCAAGVAVCKLSVTLLPDCLFMSPDPSQSVKAGPLSYVMVYMP